MRLSFFLLFQNFTMKYSTSSALNLLLPLLSLTESTPLRLLPLGASITNGTGSSSLAGYRKPLHALLTANPSFSSIDFVGTLHNGNMSDNDHEGHSGAVISDDTGFLTSRKVLDSKPNAILVHVGTNDMDRDQAFAEAAPGKMETLLTKILAELPTTTIFLSKLIYSSKKTLQDRAVVFNAALDGVAERVNGNHTDPGNRVVVVDMSNVVAPEELSDDRHPNDVGYGKMAQKWEEALKASLPLFKAPGGVSGLDATERIRLGLAVDDDGTSKRTVAAGLLEAGR